MKASRALRKAPGNLGLSCKLPYKASFGPRRASSVLLRVEGSSAVCWMGLACLPRRKWLGRDRVLDGAPSLTGLLHGRELDCGWVLGPAPSRRTHRPASLRPLRAFALGSLAFLVLGSGSSQACIPRRAGKPWSKRSTRGPVLVAVQRHRWESADSSSPEMPSMGED